MLFLCLTQDRFIHMAVAGKFMFILKALIQLMTETRTDSVKFHKMFFQQ